MRAVCVSSAGREGSQKQTQSSAEAFPVSSAASGTCQGEKDGSAPEPGEGFGYWGDCWVRGAVWGYQLLPRHSSSLLCLSHMGLWVLEKAKPLEAFLCPPVNTDLVQFNMHTPYSGRTVGKRSDCLMSLDQDISLPQLLYAPSTWLLKHQALHQMEQQHIRTQAGSSWQARYLWTG